MKPVSAMGQKQTNGNRERTKLAAARGETTQQQTSNSGGSMPAWDADDVVLFLWANSPSARERTAQEVQEQKDAINTWRNSVTKLFGPSVTLAASEPASGQALKHECYSYLQHVDYYVRKAVMKVSNNSDVDLAFDAADHPPQHRIRRLARLHSDASIQADDGLQKPTLAEYTNDAAKEFLEILATVAEDIPVPGVGLAVKVATNLIRACEEIGATLEKAEELKTRIRMLVTVVVHELKEKKSEEIQGNIKTDVEALQRELKYIENKLDEIASQHSLLLVFFRRLNVEKVEVCMSRLDALMERFTVARHIDHTILLDRLEKEITTFYNAQKQTLDHIHDVVDNINVTIEDVRAIMKTGSSAGFSSAVARASIPTNKSVFYGRDDLVLELVSHLTSASGSRERRHICILGPGGVGKTTTALAVLTHPDMKKRYADRYRVWVPCVKATSIPSLLDTLALSLGITQVTGNVKENIVSALRSSEPLILLLDNFETPWNSDGGRSDAEQILRDMDDIPHVLLVVTMRSTAPPCAELSWYLSDLKAVDATAARQIYSKIYPESSADEQVPKLLELVSNMPLAITLMATSARLSRLSAGHLIEQYKKIGPAMLSQGSDAEHSMDICVSLSVDSPPMKRSPDAQWLLSALCMLPVGTTYEMLTTWWARGLSNITGALQVLRETCLVDLHDSTFSVLPVLQRYVLDPSRFDISVRDSMVASACDFLKTYASSPSPNQSKDYTAALCMEEGNLEAILLQTVAPSTEIVDGLLRLAKYQQSTRPRTNIISHALSFVEQMGDKDIHGTTLLCYGATCCNLNRFEESRKHFNHAREVYLSIPNVKRAADCLLSYGYTYQFDLSANSATKDSLAAQAESEFELVNDIHGVAVCWLLRGITAHQDGRHDEALSLLHRAQDKFVELGSYSKSGICLNHIAITYYQQENFEQAKAWSESAVQEFHRVEMSLASINALVWLGVVHNALGNHALALEMMVKCLRWAKEFNAPLHTGLVLEQMGIAWLQLGKSKDAHGAFQEALEVYPLLPARSDRIRCGYWLKKAEDLNVVPDLDEQAALEKYHPSKALVLLGVGPM